MLARYPHVGRFVIFSRDELTQFEMAQVRPRLLSGPFDKQRRGMRLRTLSDVLD